MNEIIRLSAFFGVITIMISWEFLAPRRTNTYSRWQRWPHNIGIVFLNTIVMRLVFPMAAIGIALAAERAGWGLFNQITILPPWLVIVLCVVMLDLTIYLQHVLVHGVPLMWRFHRMHHTDLDYDVTTGSRFHPVEILFSMVIKIIVVSALGAPVEAVLVFEVILNASAMFNHANARLPLSLDRILRLFVVTPDMHRVHHSIIAGETNSNYGFALPWWDRIFGTYKDQPKEGHQDMIIGINQFRHASELRLDKMLSQPFRQPTEE